MDLETTHLPGNLDWEGFVERIHHQRLLHLNAIAVQHLLEAIFEWLEAQSARELIDGDAIVPASHQDRTTAHQVLVDGKALLVCHSLRRHDDQYVHVSWYLPGAQVYGANLIFLGQGILQVLPTGKGLLHLAEHVLRRLCGGQPKTYYLKEAG